MRIRLLLLVAPLAVLAALVAPAHAQRAVPPPEITPPAGWQADPGHADVVRRGLQAGLPAGARDAAIEVRSFRSPEPGAQVVGSVIALEPGADPAALVRQRVDELRDTARVMANGGDGVRVLGWQERVDDAGRVVEARLDWAHDKNGTRSFVRAAWVRLADPDVVAEYRAECLVAADAAPGIQGACEQALASLALPAVDVRQPIAVAAAVPTDPTGAVEAEAEEDEQVLPADDGIPLPEGAELPGMRPTPEGLDLPIARPPPKAEGRDWRPIWVVVGLLLVGAALLWNHKKRKEALEAEERERLAKQEAEAAVAAGAPPASTTTEDRPL